MPQNDIFLCISCEGADWAILLFGVLFQFSLVFTMLFFIWNSFLNESGKAPFPLPSRDPLPGVSGWVREQEHGGGPIFSRPGAYGALF